MKFRLNIAGKIGAAFGIILVAVIINAAITSITLNSARELNDKISYLYMPANNSLITLKDLIEETRVLVKDWVQIQSSENVPNKQRLRDIHSSVYPELSQSINELYKEMEDSILEKNTKMLSYINDTLFPIHKDIMMTLNTWDSYEDVTVVFTINPLVEDMNLETDKAIKKIDELNKKSIEKINEARGQMDRLYSRLTKIVFFMGVFLVIVTVLMAGLTIRSITKPVNLIRQLLLRMAQGILPHNKIAEGNDEVGQMAVAVNKLVAGLKAISNFAGEVGKGNFESEFKPLSEEDNLGNSLINMRAELKNAASEEEKRKIEDEQRNWATQGIAKFGEILRKDNDDMEKLAFNIISELVKYTNANQGGIFLLNDNDPDQLILEMAACYAYDRKKFLEKQIEIGVGLIGRCFQEKETIFLTDVPKEYINITSGLGADPPRSLILVPLIVNEEIFGVFEMASFKIFEQYQIEFLERIAETIASTISSVKINMQTALLLEQSQQQAEEMASQEEEMRQNIEELRATQEESQRREKELGEEVTYLKSILNKHNIKENEN